MTSQSPRVYTYNITFIDTPYYYYGVHKEKKFDEEYWGTPVTNKWCWEFYTPKKQILEVFDYTDKGWVEANRIEKIIIKQFYNTDRWCLNESCGGDISLDIRRKTGKIIGKMVGKKNAKRNKELGVAIFSLTPEQLSENGKKGAAKVKELGLGIFGMTMEQKLNAVKTTNSQRWMCVETGFITSSGPLTRYQQKRNINTSKRVRIS